MKINIRHAIIIILLLSLCLLDMPYGYFMLVRFIVAFSCIYRYHQSYIKGKSTLMRTFIGIAILFQPLFKIPLGRLIWNIVDIATAIFLLVIVIKNKKE